jgi:hypothetical protein
MVRLQTLDLRIGVRVPASQPIQVDILWGFSNYYADARALFFNVNFRLAGARSGLEGAAR